MWIIQIRVHKHFVVKHAMELIKTDNKLEKQKETVIMIEIF